MNPLNVWSDRLSIGLSMACTLHCLCMPLILLAFPSIAGSAFASESTHVMLLLCALPLSLFALTVGCRKHRRIEVGILGFSGLTILTWTAFFGHEWFERWGWEHMGETVFTMLGAFLMIIAHVRNLQLCRKTSDCCS